MYLFLWLRRSDAQLNANKSSASVWGCSFKRHRFSSAPATAGAHVNLRLLQTKKRKKRLAAGKMEWVALGQSQPIEPQSKIEEKRFAMHYTWDDGKEVRETEHNSGRQWRNAPASRKKSPQKLHKYVVTKRFKFNSKVVHALHGHCGARQNFILVVSLNSLLMSHSKLKATSSVT